jgi:hypothetical protein
MSMTPRIPILIVSGRYAIRPGDALIRLAPPLHEHDGEPCPACAAIGDVRVALYELLDSRRLSQQPMPPRVLVDISAVPDSAALTRDRISGKAPAGALRDHVVARSFALAE